jgi:hypothetical protein
MSRDRVPLDVPNRHVDSSFISDWMVVRANGEVVVVHEPGEGSITTFTIAEPTKNPRVMASASAVMWEGMVLDTVYKGRELLLQHTFAGVQGRLPIDVLLDEPVPTLERTELVRLKGIAGRAKSDDDLRETL